MYHCLCRDELESQCTGRVTVSTAHSPQPAPATLRPVTQSDADIIREIGGQEERRVRV